MAKKVAVKKVAKKAAKKVAKKTAAKKTRSVGKKDPANEKRVNSFTKHLGKNKPREKKKIKSDTEQEPKPMGFKKVKHENLPLHIRLNREAAERRRNQKPDPEADAKIKA